MKADFEQLDGLVRQLLYLENDSVIVRMIYASYLANLLKGPPVWLMVLGPPSCGKTELIMGLSKSTKSMVYSTVSAPALLSAYDSDVSILRPDAKGKILIIGDMSTMVTGNKERLGEAFGLLRHLYDGHVIRPTGKELLTFDGKVGFLCACTLDIDEYREFMASLGERYLYVKMRTQPDAKVFERSRKNTHIEAQLKTTIRTAAALMVKKFVPPENVSLDDETRQLLDKTASFMARIRTRIERDRYTKEVVNMPSFSEGPMRIWKQLLRIVLAAQVLGAEDDELNAILLRFAWDSIPEARSRVLKAMIINAATNTKDVQFHLKVSYNRAKHLIEDLSNLGFIQKSGPRITTNNEIIMRATTKWAQQTGRA